MTIDWWTIGLQTINAVILVWLLARFLFRPVAGVIAERQAATDAGFDAARAAEARARDALDSAAAERAGIAAERAGLLAEARAEAEAERTRLAEAARREMADWQAGRQAALQREEDARRRDMADEAGALATDIAARLLDRLPDAARVSGFVDGLADAIAALPEATRAEIGRDGPVPIRAARALGPREARALDRALSAALDRPVTTRITADPTLIAGLELATDHALARNHLRADLDRIRTELTSHDR
ncbi:F0F1 ATP synthase subunit delta [Marinibacterium sp. SX1]|uniref:F0F1 ATP synthase subunit B family protein n=1 Tax=Marinibacterium sp. SX1 TaxID=3388424 RepID=UPI003D165970